MTTIKKIEVGTLHFTGTRLDAQVRPVNGKKFELAEIQAAVGGFFELLVPAERYTTVYANEEGTLRRLPPNTHTAEACNMAVYLLNGYGAHWRVAGNILVVEKVEVGNPRAIALPTVTEALLDTNGGQPCR